MVGNKKCTCLKDMKPSKPMKGMGGMMKGKGK